MDFKELRARAGMEVIKAVAAAAGLNPVQIPCQGHSHTFVIEEALAVIKDRMDAIQAMVQGWKTGLIAQGYDEGMAMSMAATTTMQLQQGMLFGLMGGVGVVAIEIGGSDE